MLIEEDAWSAGCAASAVNGRGEATQDPVSSYFAAIVLYICACFAFLSSRPVGVSVFSPGRL